MRTLEALGCTFALASALAGNAAAQDGGTCGPDPCNPGRTLVVNAFDDVDDGACDSEHCSLREAIAAANEDALRDSVLLGLPWPDHEIRLESPLPWIWEPLVIDASSQPDVVIEANYQGDKLRVHAADTVIRGLTMRVSNTSNGAAILLRDGTGARIEGNVLMGAGILIEDATGLVVGGTEPGQGNRIVGAGTGIEISRQSHRPDSGDRIEGNEILDADIGVLVRGNYLTLGGSEPGSSNAIRGYRRAGVIVEGLYDWDISGRGIAILGNSMLSAGGIGIDLGFNGPTPNDAWDGDQGANGFQNFPVLISAELGDGVLTVAGTLHSTPLGEFRIELFASSYPESGEHLLGDVTATTDENGDLTFELTRSASADLEHFVVVSATATNLTTRETSELSDFVFIGPRDRDGDGVPNASDLCPDAFDPEQHDEDGDGVGDACDPFDDTPDADDDQVLDEYDNCPELPNADQTDTDGDGAGDTCDADDDGDGLGDSYESAYSCLSALESDAGADPDGDGLGNADEFALGSDPCLPDSDDDGLPDGVEVFGLGAFGTDPLDADSDDDDALDGSDNCPILFYEETGQGGFNPDQADLDQDGRGDVCDPDDDGDGLSDAHEPSAGTSPRDPDSDDDGALDGSDNCPKLFYEETGQSGFNPDQADLDGDGHGDLCDPDDDGDGLSDDDELAVGTNPRDPDTDADGLGDPADACPVVAPAGVDVDADGCTDTLAGLVAIVESLDLAAGLERALLAKLDDAAQALARGRHQMAIRRLGDFVSLVEARRGGSIGDSEADLLVAYAAGLIAQLEAEGA